MTVRAVVYFNLFRPIGGFRLASRVAGFLDSPDTFDALEAALERAQKLLEPHAPEDWPELKDRLEAEATPRIGGREGAVALAAFHSEDDARMEVVLRAIMPFRFWPLGGRAVWGAWYRSADGEWVPFDEKEIDRVW